MRAAPYSCTGVRRGHGLLPSRQLSATFTIPFLQVSMERGVTLPLHPRDAGGVGDAGRIYGG